jgi:hypothetical protein
MTKLKAKRSTSQIIFVAFIVATVTTIADHFIPWSSRIYAGIFAGAMIMAAIWISDYLFIKRE